MSRKSYVVPAGQSMLDSRLPMEAFRRQLAVVRECLRWYGNMELAAPHRRLFVIAKPNPKIEHR